MKNEGAGYVMQENQVMGEGTCGGIDKQGTKRKAEAMDDDGK